MHGRGARVAGGACMAGGVHHGVCMEGGMHGGGRAWQEKWQLQQVVHILPECILV